MFRRTFPVGGVQRDRHDLDEHLVVRDRGHGHLEQLRGLVRLRHEGAHRLRYLTRHCGVYNGCYVVLCF